MTEELHLPSPADTRRTHPRAGEHNPVEQELERTRNVLIEAQKIAHVGSFEFVAATQSTTWSEEEYRIYGLDPAGPSPDYDVMLRDCIHPDDRTLLHETFTAALQTHTIYELEHRITRPDGEVRWVQDRAHPYFDGQGNLVRYIGTTLDITHRKATELQLIKLKEAAEAGNRAKTLFLDNMSHELRTPMAGVMGMLDIVMRRATDPKQIDLLERCKRSAARMVAVVNDIIDFSKLEADRLPLEDRRFSVRQLVHDAVTMHDAIAQSKGLALALEVPDTLSDRLSGDAFRLRQILLNYLGNACKFSDHGTITVRLAAPEQDGVSVLLRIEVEDQGIGISAEQQAALFQAFAQVDEQPTRQHGGSGLGLVISKRLAKMMGGDAGLISEEGCGSTVWATARLKLVHSSEDQAG